MNHFPRWLLTTLVTLFFLFGAVRSLGAETAAGKIKSIDFAKQVMVLEENDGTTWTMSLPEGALVRPLDRESAILESLFSAAPANNAPDPAETLFPDKRLTPRVEYNYKLSDLRAGDEVIVTFDDVDDQWTVAEIRVKTR
ncbi:hypothetical protein AYO44_08710 [Planctomycetaceae bacterium SCGC AG-212-F19]|nr:hypothetical protein AYO44_08710 [Planctomycetaceae bacterium SCGC AG-212-F19]